jgi:beta-1,4-N-acetylglucosaminyltransferase
MIFVTVGTTHFDDLIREVDRLCSIGVIVDNVIAQIGSGSYEPIHMKWFRYSKDIHKYFEDSQLCICHGGVGSIFELLAIQKDIIVVANRSLKDDHQSDLLRMLEKHNWFRCCFNLVELEKALKDNSPREPYPLQMQFAKTFGIEVLEDTGHN